MLAVGNQVKIIGELHRFRNFLKDINTEPLAALFDVTLLLICFISNRAKKQTNKKNKNQAFIQEAKYYPLPLKLQPQSRHPFTAQHNLYQA